MKNRSPGIIGCARTERILTLLPGSSVSLRLAIVPASFQLAVRNRNCQPDANPEGWRDKASRRLALLQSGGSPKIRPRRPHCCWSR